jgi:hypothetical protein
MEVYLGTDFKVKLSVHLMDAKSISGVGGNRGF